MELLLSSKHLGTILSKHHEDIKKVEYAEVVRGELLLCVGNGFLHINVSLESSSAIMLVSQQKVRWDWIMQAAISIPEQPIILELNDNSAKIILQF